MGDFLKEKNVSRKVQLGIMIAIVVLLGFVAGIKAELNTGASKDGGRTDGFYMSIR
jgi:hypothetical protein